MGKRFSQKMSFLHESDFPPMRGVDWFLGRYREQKVYSGEGRKGFLKNDGPEFLSW